MEFVKLLVRSSVFRRIGSLYLNFFSERDSRRHLRQLAEGWKENAVLDVHGQGSGAVGLQASDACMRNRPSAQSAAVDVWSDELWS